MKKCGTTYKDKTLKVIRVANRRIVNQVNEQWVEIGINYQKEI